MGTRRSTDILGTVEIPEGALWGSHTFRALENFSIAGRPVHPSLIRAIAAVKKAAALANHEVGDLSEDRCRAIGDACDEIRAGQWEDQFPVDALQGGAGTSTHMNVNEVVATRASQILGGGEVDPFDHVNRHQSTNDVFPTAVRIAAIEGLRSLSSAAAALQGALQRKEKEFAGVVKIGRTEMQEAVPMTLGAEFAAWAEGLGRDRWRVFKCEERLRVVNLGGTAVGTGMGAPRDYIFLVIEKLREVTGMGLSRGENLTGETANADVFVEVSAILKAHAVNLMKMSNDLRLLNALGEVRLPPLQAGSSIMPGKVNPVVCESAIQGALQVIANDGLVTESASRGTCQINEFLPLLADSLLGSLGILERLDQALAKYVERISVDEARCRSFVDQSRMIVTAFVPHLGYGRCGELLKEFEGSRRTDLRRFLEEKLGDDMVGRILSPENLMALGYRRERT
ncbi:MAG: aspartate ammonia-lyase [Elusimicrobia bacterium]|nr:aspartate ammonia-lyase [Elusimicrobiota bacterium]